MNRIASLLHAACKLRNEVTPHRGIILHLYELKLQLEH